MQYIRRLKFSRNAKSCIFPLNAPNFANRVSNEKSHSTDKNDVGMSINIRNGQRSKTLLFEADRGHEFAF